MKNQGDMKIEIEYNGGVALCRIEPMDKPGKMVNFDEADNKSQAYALGAFQCIREKWQREQRLEQFKNHPVMHIRREFQVKKGNLDKIDKLLQEGVVLKWSYDPNRDPDISVTLRDGHTIVGTNGWLIQDTEGRWWGIYDGYHRMLEEYQKIVIKQ